MIDTERLAQVSDSFTLAIPVPASTAGRFNMPVVLGVQQPNNLKSYDRPYGP